MILGRRILSSSFERWGEGRGIRKFSPVSVNYRPILREEWANVEILFVSLVLAFGSTE